MVYLLHDAQCVPHCTIKFRFWKNAKIFRLTPLPKKMGGTAPLAQIIQRRQRCPILLHITVYSGKHGKDDTIIHLFQFCTSDAKNVDNLDYPFFCLKRIEREKSFFTSKKNE